MFEQLVRCFSLIFCPSCCRHRLCYCYFPCCSHQPFMSRTRSMWTERQKRPSERNRTEWVEPSAGICLQLLVLYDASSLAFAKTCLIQVVFCDLTLTFSFSRMTLFLAHIIQNNIDMSQVWSDTQWNVCISNTRVNKDLIAQEPHIPEISELYVGWHRRATDSKSRKRWYVSWGCCPTEVEWWVHISGNAYFLKTLNFL